MPRQFSWMPGTRACPRAARSADPRAGHERLGRVNHLDAPEHELLQGVLDRTGEPVETGGKVARDVHAQGAPAALRQHVEIAARLRLLDNAEGVGLAGDRQVLAVVAGDLQEDAAVRAALIGLPRRVLE